MVSTKANTDIAYAHHERSVECFGAGASDAYIFIGSKLGTVELVVHVRQTCRKLKWSLASGHMRFGIQILSFKEIVINLFEGPLCHLWANTGAP